MTPVLWSITPSTPNQVALRQIVGGPLRTQALDQRKLGLRAALQRQAQVIHAEVEHALEGALQKRFRRGQAMDVDIAADALVGAPQARHAEDPGVQGLGGDEAPPQRHSDRDHALAKTFEQLLEARAPQALPDQPVGDRRDLGPRPVRPRHLIQQERVHGPHRAKPPQNENGT
jgi:hypothetical protein